MSGARLKHYGWGREGEGMTAAEQAFVLGREDREIGQAGKDHDLQRGLCLRGRICSQQHREGEGGDHRSSCLSHHELLPQS